MNRINYFALTAINSGLVSVFEMDFLNTPNIFRKATRWASLSGTVFPAAVSVAASSLGAESCYEETKYTCHAMQW